MTSTYSHILYITNFHDTSTNLTKVAAIAEHLGARISLLHVVEQPEKAVFLMQTALPQRKLLALAWENMIALSHELCVPGFDLRVLVSQHPVQKIVQITKELCPELVLIGGRQQIAQTDKPWQYYEAISQQTDCDILTI